jgi:hypothetical protein
MAKSKGISNIEKRAVCGEKSSRFLSVRKAYVKAPKTPAPPVPLDHEVITLL